MIELKTQIIEYFKQIGRFIYATWEPSKYDKSDIQSDVIDALNFYCPSQSFSRLLIDQLIELQGSGMVKICDYSHPYIPTEIYWTLRKIVNGEIDYKPFKKKSSKLFGRKVLHVHHSQSFYIMKNCIRYFENRYKDDNQILKRLLELQIEYPERNDHMVLFANEVLSSSVEWPKKTGEWIVYQLVDDSFHFLCLYIHDYEDSDDSKLYDFIKNELLQENHLHHT